MDKNYEQISLFPKLTTDGRKIKIIELFAGIGAQSRALERLQEDGLLPNGFEVQAICEIDKYAVSAYNGIHNTNFKPSDITKIHASDLGKIETDKYFYIMFYSFPCTDISVSGKLKGFAEDSNTRSSLLHQVKRLLDEMEVLPQCLIMENVKNIVSKRFKSDFDKWLDYLASKGYKTSWKILNATEFNVPQNRERVFAVSWLDQDKEYTFPSPIRLEYCMQDFLEDEDSIEEKYYLPQDKIDELLSNSAIEITED